MNESLSVVATNTDAGFMPGWVTSSGDNLYSISRTSAPGSASDSGGVFAFRKSPVASGKGPVLFDQASSNGKGGVHCEVSPNGKILAAANITASTISIYPLSDDGAIGKPAQILDYNKLEPDSKETHLHQVTFDPSGQFLAVPLRTGDRLDIYSLAKAKQITKAQSIPLPNLTGPRHVAFNPVSPSKTYLYLVSEKDNAIRVYSMDYQGPGAQGLTVEFKQVLSTMGKDLGPQPNGHKKDLAAEIAVSNDGRFVYVSNRNLTSAEHDTLAIYSVDGDAAHDDQHLTYLGCQGINGKHPRMIALSNDKDNKWVAVANQFSQDIIIFERETTTGFLKDVKGRLSLKVAEPHQTRPENVTFVDTVMGAKLAREELLKGRQEGPMCVLWE